MKKRTSFKNKKIKIPAAIALCLVVAIVSSGVSWMVYKNKFTIQNPEISQKINEIDQYVSKNYIGKLSSEDLKTGVAYGYLLGTKDTYAAYYPPDEYKKQMESNEGMLTGIGVKASKDKETKNIKVEGVYADSPASKSGVEAGDYITAVDSQSVSDMTLDDAVNKMRGEANTEVKITVLRSGNSFDVTITREKFEIPEIKFDMIDGYAYIKIEAFKKSALNQFKEALEKAQQNGAKGIIFDLRDNGGGLLDTTCDMLNPLLPKGIMGTEVSADGKQRPLGFSDDNELHIPMATITNGETASAAELFVCNLKDYNKAFQVGTKTYGKGVLQTTTKLSDGSGLKITTAYFNPAKSENFNEKGVIPDYEVSLNEDQDQKFKAEKLSLKDDLQVQKAISVFKEKN